MLQTLLGMGMGMNVTAHASLDRTYPCCLSCLGRFRVRLTQIINMVLPLTSYIDIAY